MTKTLKLFIVSSVLLFTAFYSLGSKSIQNVSATSLCGNGIINTSEECDDGNNVNNDNCSNNCVEKKVTICHATSSEVNPYNTLTIGWNAVYGPSGHFYENGTTRAGHEDDHLGECTCNELNNCPTATPTIYCSPTPTNSPTATNTPVLTPTNTLTNTPSPTNTPIETPTPTNTPTSTPTNSPTPTNTPTAEPTRTCEDDENCPTSTPTSTPTETPSPTPTQQVTGTPQPTQTPVPTPTPTDSPSVGGGDNGGSSPGAPVCNDPKPGTPSNLRVTRISSTQIRLDWDHAADPHTSYVVAYGPSIGNYPWGSPNVGNGNSYTVNSLTPGAQYCFYVRAQNNCMPGDKSNEVCINVGSTVKILGVTDNYNPLVEGIRESYGGDILGTTTELMATAEVVYSQSKLPSGNTLASGQSISIPKLGVNQPIYNPARIGDDFTVGHQEVLHTTIDGSSVFYGHNGYDVFGGLHKANLGDMVKTNNNGVDSGYKVTEKLFVHKSQVDSIKTTDDQIVLVTCSFTQPDYRIVVKASLTK